VAAARRELLIVDSRLTPKPSPRGGLPRRRIATAWFKPRGIAPPQIPELAVKWLMWYALCQCRFPDRSQWAKTGFPPTMNRRDLKGIEA
jgi:hypothetical protein